MINSKRPLEGFLQRYRFRKAKSHLTGDVLDFGGNDGELRPYVKGTYTLVNYDHSPMEGKTFDTIVLLAVIEHIEVDEVHGLFKKFKAALRPGGKIVLTTPTRLAKPVIDFLSFVGLIDKHNIDEHKHYWSKKDVQNLADGAGLKLSSHKYFQGGCNQIAVMVNES
jgi:2-polyprenyl-3-methyl-5-hydroxy-6-metoxy-1,4-benzoquinol methylase